MSQRLLWIPALLLVLCGCSTVPLPSRFPLHGWTPMTDEKGQPLPVDRDFLRATKPDSEGGASAPIGLHLQPGDVIYLRRWSPGMSSVDDPLMNHASPLATVDRIPLRRVPAGSRLYDYEREFLINVLTTNRAIAFGQVQDRLAGELRGHEVRLWNALVESLILKRFVGDGSDSNLVLTVRMPDLLASLPDDLQAAFRGAPKPDENNTGVRMDRDFEVTSTQDLLISPYHALGGPGGQNPSYYSATFPFPRFNFLTVELSGAQMTRPGWEESQWTLREWEESGICFAQDSSGQKQEAKIQWVQVTTSRRTFHIVAGKPATHRIWNRVTLQGHERRLDPTPHVSWGHSTLPEEDLDKLTLRDIRRIWWSVPDRELAHPDNCQIP